MIAIVEITRACNLHCGHCLMGDRGRDLALDALLDGISSLSPVVRDARFVGGEPLLVPDRLGAAMDRARGLGMVTSFTTNGLLVPKHIDAIRGWRPWNVCLSMDGTGNAHDLQRGQAGAWDAVLTAAAALREAGQRWSALCCLTRLNVDEIERVHAACEEGGADHLRFWPMIPVRPGSRDLLLSPGEVRAALQRARALRGGVDVRVPALYSDSDADGYRCVAGEAWIYVQSDGVVTPCMYAPQPVGRLGDDVRTLAAAARIPGPPSACAGCAHAATCRGGCRGATWCTVGHYDAVDPGCWVCDDARGVG